jgi:hypothetical protein
MLTGGKSAPATIEAAVVISHNSRFGFGLRDARDKIEFGAPREFNRTLKEVLKGAAS